MSNSDLSGFSSRSVKTKGAWKDSPPRLSAPPNSDKCPNGWDKDTWYLTLLFDAISEFFDAKQKARRPIMYAELDKRIRDSGIRTQDVPFTTDQLRDTLDKQLYDVAKVDLSGPIWRQFVTVMIYDFWTRHWDDNALYEFTNKQTFINIWSDIATRGVVDDLLDMDQD